MSTQASTSSGSSSNGATAENAPIDAPPNSTVSSNIVSQAIAAPPPQPPVAPPTTHTPTRMPGVNPNWARAFADQEPRWSYDAPPTLPDWTMPGNMNWPLDSSSDRRPVKWDADKNSAGPAKK